MVMCFARGRSLGPNNHQFQPYLTQKTLTIPYATSL